MTLIHKSQAGNALIIVLLTVALFGALIFTFTRSGRQGSGNLTGQQTRIAAQDILSFARAVEDGVNRVRQKSTSENDLDFRNDIVAGYDNGGCGDTKCQVFDTTNGGKAVWQSPPNYANDGSEWIISGEQRVAGIGTDGTTAANADLILVLPNVSREVCLMLNEYLGIDNPADEPPQADNDVDYTTIFTGSFAAGDLLSNTAFDGESTACFEGAGTPATGTYHFYHVLLAR